MHKFRVLDSVKTNGSSKHRMVGSRGRALGGASPKHVLPGVVLYRFASPNTSCARRHFFNTQRDILIFYYRIYIYTPSISTL